MKKCRAHALSWGLVGCIFFWGRGAAQSTHQELNMSKADSVIVADSLQQYESICDTVETVIEDSTVSRMQEDIPYDSDWSWLSMGKVCFADSVILYDPGAPGLGTGNEPELKYQDENAVLGPPDYHNNDSGFVSLGSGGTLILAFNDNVFFDGPGPDLYFWMPDENSEDVTVWISNDNIIYEWAGVVSSSSPYLDLKNIAAPGAFYTILKLRDDDLQGNNDRPSLGADIDAVVAIHSALVQAYAIKDLFNDLEMKPTAPDLLQPTVELVRQYPNSQILIEVYTDNLGTEDFNLLLSQRWAKMIRDYFLNDAKQYNHRYTGIGLGHSQPFYHPYLKKSIDYGVVAIIIFCD